MSKRSFQRFYFLAKTNCHISDSIVAPAVNRLVDMPVKYYITGLYVQPMGPTARLAVAQLKFIVLFSRFGMAESEQ
jgi:hypothetical protein